MTTPDPQYGGQPSGGQYGGPPPGGQPYQPYPNAPQYGAAPYPGQYGSGYPTPQQGSNGLAVAGLVCGIVGVLVANIILGPLAIIFGAIGLSRAKRGAPRKTMSGWALGLGIFDVALWIVLLAVVANNHGFIA